ncbi:MAG: LLM class flavin-dependent oxidoreductase [Streptosporangiaceae bacterium]
MTVRVGSLVFPQDLAVEPDEARRRVDAIADAGLDHVGVADHVSFRDGQGFDGLATAAVIAGLHPSIVIQTSVYILPLRPPVPIARQVSTLLQLAPGRLIFGVGIGGEDRHEVSICGIDPHTRGRRADEYLTVLRGLLSGEAVDFRGEFVELRSARVLPAPSSPPPILVGGRSGAALARTARLGEGWLGLWVSARRFAEATELVAKEAESIGRDDVDWQHGLLVWCGLDSDPRSDIAERLARHLHAFYGLDFTAFSRYTPCGTPEHVAEGLRPYVDAGARSITLIPVAESFDAAVEGAARVRKLLTA